MVGCLLVERKGRGDIGFWRMVLYWFVGGWGICAALAGWHFQHELQGLSLSVLRQDMGLAESPVNELPGLAAHFS
jgi:hypothetical protein